MRGCYRTYAVAALKASSDKLLQSLSYFCISGTPPLALFTSCPGVPILQELWFTRVPLEFATRVRRPLSSNYPSCEAVPFEESTAPSPSSWSHSPGPFRHHSSGMNLVQHRGAPCFCWPGSCTWRESQVALDFDPPAHVLQLKPRSDE